MKLRCVSIADADLLFDWRNDLETCKASHNTEEVSRSDHIIWLSKSLDNQSRKLFIAEENDIAVGTIRADLSNGVWELSWTTAPAMRGKKVAKKMVSILAQKIIEPIRAEIKKGNIISSKVAESAGMKSSHESNGIVHYFRSGV